MTLYVYFYFVTMHMDRLFLNFILSEVFLSIKQLKVTVNVISSGHLCEDSNACFTIVPLITSMKDTLVCLTRRVNFFIVFYTQEL